MPERISLQLFTVFSEIGSVPHCGTIFRRPAEQRQELRLFASALIRENRIHPRMNSRPMKIFARDVQWEFSREVCSSLYRRATLSPGAGRWDGPNVCWSRGRGLRCNHYFFK